MFMARSVIWALSLTSIAAVALSAVLAGRHIGVDPDLRPQRTVVIAPASAEATRTAREEQERTDADRHRRVPGARSDPRAPVPVEPHDETAERGEVEDDPASDAADDAGDAADDAADQAQEDAEDREGALE